MKARLVTKTRYGFKSHGTRAKPMISTRSVARRDPSLMPLHLADRLGAEKPRWSNDQDQHDHEKGGDIHEAGVQITTGEILDHPHAQSAQHRPGEIAEAAQHGGGKGLDQKRSPNIGERERDWGHQHPCQGAHTGSYAPDDRKYALDANPHQRRGSLVFSRRLHHLTQPGPAEEGGEHSHTHERAA